MNFTVSYFCREFWFFY